MNHKAPGKPTWRQHLLGLAMFLGLLILIAGGMATALGYTPRPRPLGWIVFLGASATAVVTVDRWARGLGVVFGTAALNGLLILTTGHALNQPSLPVPRSQGAMAFLLGVLASTTTARLSVDPRELGFAVRCASLGIMACGVAVLTCSMASAKHWEAPTLVAFVLSLIVLRIGISPRSGRTFRRKSN